MTFQTVPAVVAGPSYKSRTRPLSSQSTINFYQEFDDSGKSPVVLHSFPGQKLFGNAGGVDRGATVMRGVIYRVSGSNLYKVDSNGAHTDKGFVLGNDRCIFANDGQNLFIVNAGTVQQYNSSTDMLSTVTDTNISGAIAVSFINNQFIYTKPDLFVISNVGDGSTASGLNGAQAESQPDDLVFSYVFDGIAYMMGTGTIEPWYNDGTSTPPFVRIDGQIQQVGLASLHSVANNDNFMYWLGDDRQVYRLSSGTSAQRVSSKAIAHAIEGYDTVSDSVAWVMTMEGQNFYVLSFPSENKTWAINEGLGEDGWFELSADDLEGKYNCTSHVYSNGKNFVCDELNGNIYQLDLDTFTNNDEAIERTRVMSSIHGGLLGQPGKRLQMSRFELIMDMGVGLITGQGEDPLLSVEYSIDGGKSFENGGFLRVGRMGETNIRAEWFSLITFYDLIIRITTSDPVHYTLMSGAIDLRLAGR